MIFKTSQNFLKKYAPNFIFKILRHFAHQYGNKSYSQEGEDLILKRFFENTKNGFFVDIGAHHPFRFSNTYLFYKEGWRGINIDAMPGSMNLFKIFRSKDINLELGIGLTSTPIPFYIFNEPALNTFDKKLATQRNVAPYKIQKTISIPIKPLSKILDENLPVGRRIDFLSIDVEGKDLEVLKSNAWDKYRPKVIVIETSSKDIKSLSEDACTKYLANLGYTAFAKAIHTSFFIDDT